jgi:NAD(P)-dependent dehydrogenase (short-subunit alcohol dehydrogenase family)
MSSAAGSLIEMDDIESSHFPYHYPAYKISKCALNMYMRTLAARLKHEGTNIIVSSVHPGWVKTDMGGDEAPTTPEEAAENIYKLAVSRPETGQFWYNGKKYPW